MMINMNNDNSSKFLQGFSAIDDDDRRENAKRFSDGREEPTFNESSIDSSSYSQSNGRAQEPSFGNMQDDSREPNYSEPANTEHSSSENYQEPPLENNNAGNGNNGNNNNKNKSSDDNGAKKSNKASLKKRFIFFMLKAGASVFVLLALVFVYLDSVVATGFGVDDKWVLPAVVYSRPLELYPDQKLSLKQMQYELDLLKYRKVSNPQTPGEYACNEKTGRIVILRRPFDFPDASENMISLMVAFNGQRITEILNADTHEELGYVRMDPVLLDRINRIDPKEDRIFIQLQEVPKPLIRTLLEIEDRSFETNLGVNFFAIARAFIKNTIAHSVVEGGSTITQQLVKNYFLSSEKSYSRKIKEIFMALIMNHRYTKDQILEAYLNEIYLGQNGSAGVYGFGLASYFYFGVPVSELSQDQMALLVGIIKGPSYYDPWRHPEQALERRNVVLAVLKNREVITPTEYEQYIARPLGVIKRGSMNYSKTPAFMGVLKREIATKFGPDFLSGNGIKIFTSLDPQSQQAAEKAVQNELNTIESETRQKGMEAAMVVSSWRTAEVSAWKRPEIVQLTARSSQHFSLATTILSVERLHSKRVYSSIQKIQIPFPSVVTGASWLITPPQEPIW